MKNTINYAIIAIVFPLTAVFYGLLYKNYAVIPGSILSVGCILFITILNKKVPVLNTGTLVAILVFILLSLFLGNTLNLYSIIPHWDKILHFISGFIAFLAGTDVYIKYNGTKSNRKLMYLFSLFFAISVAAIWEIYEFGADSILKTSTQNSSLTDTMTDIIAGSVSAFLSIFFKKYRN